MLKVGDRVESLVTTRHYYTGDTGVVLEARPGRRYYVRWDIHRIVGGGQYYANPEKLRLVVEPTKPTRVGTTLPTDSTARKNFPLWRGLLRYFPAALAGAAKVSKLGNDKHNPGQELHHARGKSMDHGDCVLRHMLDVDADYGKGVGLDEDGVPQVDYIVWRALAFAQEWHEAHGAPLAPAARVPK